MGIYLFIYLLLFSAETKPDAPPGLLGSAENMPAASFPSNVADKQTVHLLGAIFSTAFISILRSSEPPRWQGAERPTKTNGRNNRGHWNGETSQPVERCCFLACLGQTPGLRALDKSALVQTFHWNTQMNTYKCSNEKVYLFF